MHLQLVSGNRLETPYGKGVGLSLHGIQHVARLQKLQRYLFIDSVNRYLVSFHSVSDTAAQALGSPGLSEPAFC